MARHASGTEKARRARIANLMHTHKIDSIDVEILQALQIKGRASNVEIAEFAGLTAPPTLRRTRTLECKRIILGYHAILDGKKLGYEVTAFLQVMLSAQTADDIDRFEARVGAVANVRECYALNGQRDFLLKCVFRDLAEAQHFVTDTLLHMDNIAAVKSSFVIRATKQEGGVPLSLLDVPPPLPAVRAPRKVKRFEHR